MRLKMKSPARPKQKLKVKLIQKLPGCAKAKPIAFASNRKEPRIAGMPDKNENLNAASGLTPLAKRLTMVIPEREIPGIIVNPWLMPSTKASLKFRAFISLPPLLLLLLKIKIQAVTNNAAQTKAGFSNSPSKNLLPSRANAAVISVTTRICAINTKSASVRQISLAKKQKSEK